MATLKIKKGDTVYVLAGDDKGKTGRVLNILREQGKAIVEGVNIVSKSTKPNAKAPQGGIIKKEAPINLSNLAVECSVADIDAAIELSKNGEDLCTRLHRAGAAIEFRPSMETIAWYSVIGEDWNGNRHVLRVTR